MSIGTILLVILVIALCGGFTNIGGGPGYGYGYYVLGIPGILVVIIVLLILFGRI